MLKRLGKLPYPDPGVPAIPRPFWRLMKSMGTQLLRFLPLRRFGGEVIIYLGECPEQFCIAESFA
jgi:hypothetical protein